jgi:hypothetical protein
MYEDGAWVQLALDKILLISFCEYNNQPSGCTITGYFLISGAGVPQRPGTDLRLLPVAGLPFDTFKGTML